MRVIMSTNLERYSIEGKVLVYIDAKKRKKKEKRSLSDKRAHCEFTRRDFYKYYIALVLGKHHATAYSASTHT